MLCVVDKIVEAQQQQIKVLRAGMRIAALREQRPGNISDF